MGLNKITSCYVENGLQVGENRSKETSWDAISVASVRDGGDLDQHGNSQGQGDRSRRRVEFCIQLEDGAKTC